MTTSMMSRILKGDPMGDVDISFGAHERLARELLAVEAGGHAEVREAMKEIIASAPKTMDVALVLSLALTRAGDRALGSAEPSVLVSREWESAQLSQRSGPLGPSHERRPSRWWAAAAMPLLGVAVVFAWLGQLALRAPDPGTDPAGMALPMFTISVASLGAALAWVETLILLRRQARGSVDVVVRLAPLEVGMSTQEVGPPGAG